MTNNKFLLCWSSYNLNFVYIATTEGSSQRNALKLHGEDATKAANLQGLFTELKTLDRENGKEDFFKIEFPAPETPDEERQKIFEEIRERLIQLFAASVQALIGDDNEPLMRDYVPVPGKGGPYFDKDDLDVLADDVRRLLDPEDNHFHAALADREVGAIKLLGQTLNFAIAHYDPRAAFKFFQIITRNVREQLAASGYVDHKLTELPWEGNGIYRKNILRQRLNVMMQFDYHFKNIRFVEMLHKRFPKQDRFWNELVDVFNAATRDLKVSNLNSEQWFYVLVSRLVRIQQMTRGLYDALLILTRQIRTATEPQQISAAIDTFTQQTLPAIFPPSPHAAASPSPSVEAPEAPEPKSS